MSLSNRDEIFHSPITNSEDALYEAAMSGNNDIIVSILVNGIIVDDYRILVEKIDELGYKDAAVIVKNHFEQPWVLKMIEQYKFKDKQKLISAIYRLSQNRVIMLKKISMQLIENFKFTEETLLTLVSRVAQKNLDINMIGVKKHKDSIKSTFTSNQQILFYQERRAVKNSVLKGTRGVITKGFTKQNAEQPVYAVKWMDSISYAKREAKSQQRLGRMRPTIFSYGNKSAVMLEWRPGKTLGAYSSQNFINFPLLSRVKCLIELLTDLNMLHSSLHCHYDINGGNVLVDLEHETMSLIDFELSGKPHDKLAWQGDMNSIGEIIENLVPEIGSQKELSILERAIYDLRESMKWYSFSLSAMPTSEQALQYCQEILTNLSGLNAKMLKVIADRTINRTDPTLEDMVRLCERSKFIKSV